MTERHPASRLDAAARRRAVLSWSLKLAVSASLIWLLVHRSDFDTITVAMGRISVQTIAVILFLYCAGMFLSAVKWRLLIPNHPLRDLAALNFVAQFYAIALAGQLAGEVVKALKLARGRRDAELIAASIVVDKITGLLAVLLVGVAGVAIGRVHLPQVIGLALAALLAGGIVGLFLLKSRRAYAFIEALPRRLFPPGSRFAGLAARLDYFLGAWRTFLERPWILAGSILLGCAMHALNVAIIVAIADELGIDLAAADWVWVYAVVSVATILPLSLGGIGIREGAFVGVLGFLGIGSELALALSFTILGLQLFGALIGAAIDLIGWRGRTGHAPREEGR